MHVPAQLRSVALAAAVFVAAGGGPASAQVIRGQIVDGTTQAPIPGAFIVLLDSAGTRRGGVLSGQSGSFILKAPQAGRYTLRAERIGYANTYSDTLRVVDGKTLAYRFEISVKAVDLEGLKVTGKSRCRVSREMGAQTNTLWEEVRKALSIAVWSDEAQGVPFQAVVWSRTRGLRSLEIQADTLHVRSGYGRTPFTSESARSLSTKGYVRAESDGSFTFYGLDAPTVLSDDFLQTHCFRLENGGKDEKGLIGLAFEPVDRKGPPDIEGTLWVDRATSELRYLEFRYDKIPYGGHVPTKPFGGRVYFRRLDNGDWVVERWWLRMPQSVTMSETDGQVHLGTRIHEQGGRILFVGAAETSDAEGRSELSGTVWDSTRSVPLAHANVFLTDINRATVTDFAGHFRFDSLPEGTHRVAFTHPRADSLGLPVSPRSVAVDPNHYRSVRLAIPRHAGCPTSPTTGGVVGFVEDVETGDPLPHTAVKASWWVRGVHTILPTRDKIEEHADTSDAHGRFLFCGVPVGEEVDMEPDHGDAVKLQLDKATLVWRELLAHPRHH